MSIFQGCGGFWDLSKTRSLLFKLFKYTKSSKKFQSGGLRTSHELALVYNDKSPLENMHCLLESIQLGWAQPQKITISGALGGSEVRAWVDL